MKKNFMIFMTALIVVAAAGLLIGGGQSNTRSLNEQGTRADLPPDQSSGGDAGSAQQPHQFGDFKGAGYKFTGGTAVSGYNLSAIRRVSHPELVRLVFQFTEGNSGVPGTAPPAYSVELEHQKIIISLQGVDRADVMNNKKDILALSPLIKDVTFNKIDSYESKVSLYLTDQASFQVFDLGQPSRIVIVLKPEKTEGQEL